MCPATVDTWGELLLRTIHAPRCVFLSVSEVVTCLYGPGMAVGFITPSRTGKTRLFTRPHPVSFSRLPSDISPIFLFLASFPAISLVAPSLRSHCLPSLHPFPLSFLVPQSRPVLFPAISSLISIFSSLDPFLVFSFLARHRCHVRVVGKIFRERKIKKKLQNSPWRRLLCPPTPP